MSFMRSINRKNIDIIINFVIIIKSTKLYGINVYIFLDTFGTKRKSQMQELAD